MGTVKEIHDFWESLYKNKITRFIIILIFGSIALFFLTIAFKAIIGDPMKIFGVEINQNNKQIVYVKETAKNKLIMPLIKPDTLQKVVPVKHLLSKPITLKKEESKLKDSDTIKPVAKYIITAPMTQSAVGDNASVTNNNYGIKPRVFTETEQSDVMQKANKLFSENPQWDKTLKIHYNIPIQNEEATHYADQIYGLFKINGYDKFEVHYYMVTNPIGNYEVKKETNNGESFITINVYPQKTIGN